MKKIFIVVVMGLVLFGDEFAEQKELAIKISPTVLIAPVAPLIFGDVVIEVEKTLNKDTSIAVAVGDTNSKMWDDYSLNGQFVEAKVYGFLDGVMNNSVYLSLQAGVQNGTLQSNSTTNHTRYYYGLYGGRLYMFGPFSLNVDAGVQQHFITTLDGSARISLGANLLLGFAF